MIVVFPDRFVELIASAQSHYSLAYTKYVPKPQLMNKIKLSSAHLHHLYRISVVECLTRDRGVVGSSFTGVTALCP